MHALRQRGIKLPGGQQSAQLSALSAHTCQPSDPSPWPVTGRDSGGALGLWEVVWTPGLPQTSLLPSPQLRPLLAMLLKPGQMEAEALGREPGGSVQHVRGQWAAERLHPCALGHERRAGLRGWAQPLCTSCPAVRQRPLSKQPQRTESQTALGPWGGCWNC